MPVRLKNIVLRHPLTALTGFAIAVFGLHATTLFDYPSCWFDEIEILELGRFSFFDIRPNWSINLIPSTADAPRVPMPYFHYLYAAILESLYRLTGSFAAGRVLGLMSLPVCALLLYKWLATKGFGTLALLATAILFLLDPNATICAHWYRPDLWTLSLAFAAMILLSRSRAKAAPPRRFACCAAGALTSTMLFTWITSMLLLPLIGWEAIMSVRRHDGEPVHEAIRRGFLDAVAFAVGGLLATAVWLIPLYPYIPAIVSQYAELSELGGTGNSSGILQRIVDFVKITVRSPCIWPLAALGVTLALRKRTIHALIFIGLCLLMVRTRVYHLRMIQLLPFLFLFAADAIDRISSHRNKFLSLCAKAILPLAAASYFALSVVALNYAAIPSGNTFAALTERLGQALPSASPKVYLYDMEHELYYSGRRLGWQMYSYPNRKTIFDASLSANLMDKLDAVVVTAAAKEPPTEAELELLRQKGFTKVTDVKLPRTRGNRVKELLADLFYAHGYPNCTVYGKVRHF